MKRKMVLIPENELRPLDLLHDRGEWWLILERTPDDRVVTIIPRGAVRISGILEGENSYEGMER